MTSHHVDAEALAQEVGKVMWAHDQASQSLDLRLLDIAPGRARVELKVRREMTNGFGICHGGVIFTLADSAFAYACNSHNKNTVASACHIDFLAPAKVGETLIAEGVEQSMAGRTGVYDITVRNGDGRAVALFRGKAYRINGEVIATLAQAGVA
ncbi:MAG: hydroxyphenylacetyl-CoA thioesterase PaaI [Burkholderiales bacterium]